MRHMSDEPHLGPEFSLREFESPDVTILQFDIVISYS
jgi:hypothetical protein